MLTSRSASVHRSLSCWASFSLRLATYTSKIFTSKLTHPKPSHQNLHIQYFNIKTYTSKSLQCRRDRGLGSFGPLLTACKQGM